MSEKDVLKAEDGDRIDTAWGQLNWKMAASTHPGAVSTFGTCFIQPGMRNELHSHPDCEEVLYVVSGRCEHRLGEETHILEAGDAIRIPRTVRHWAKCISEEPLFALIYFSSGHRTAINHEGEGAA